MGRPGLLSPNSFVIATDLKSGCEKNQLTDTEEGVSNVLTVSVSHFGVNSCGLSRCNDEFCGRRWTRCY